MTGCRGDLVLDYRDIVSLLKRSCLGRVVVYGRLVPKLWSETVEAHRRGVREAILDTTASLVTEHGLRAVTMSQVAEQTGIGRATLYKYFADVDAIMRAWHDRQINNHLGYLAEIRDQAGDPADRLEAVLRAYAVISQQTHGHHSTELGAFLHRDEQLAHAQHQLHHLITELLAEAIAAGDIRDDIAPAELANYCLHSLSAAGGLPSAAAVRRLVTVTLDGLRSSPG